MNSVKCWEQLRRMGIQSDLHTLATLQNSGVIFLASFAGTYTVYISFDQ